MSGEALCDLRGLKVWVYVLGCRSNLYESEALAGELEARGAVVSDRSAGCRAAVIVSCSVTATADKKCRQAVRRARREFGPDGAVAVCGCWAQSLASDEAQELGIDILVGNRLKGDLPDALQALLAMQPRTFIDMRADLKSDRIWDPLTLNHPVLRSRAFLKVQEGCDHFCTYCAIPFLRGRSTSRPAGEAVEEARRLVAGGCREIVLTGIHLGMYGRDTDTSLAALIRDISAIPDLRRLRLGSLEPFAPDDELLAAMAESPVFCPHLHLPLQSGDDEILGRMRRGHTADEYLRVCDRARSKLGDDLHISSDVLVAFPGESDDAFRNTLSVMERAGLGRVHVFPYSPRNGTLAATFPGRISPQAASERVAAAMALGEELLQRYASRFVGKVVPVLYGYTPHFVETAPDKGSAPFEPDRESGVRMTDCAGGILRGCRI